jgi:MFS family permease
MEVFLTCSSIDLVALMDQTTLAASLNIVSRALGAGSKSAWIAGAYFLYAWSSIDLQHQRSLHYRVRTSTSFQLLYGRLSDIFSRKTVLLSCIFIFFVGSLAASLAQTATQIIAFRALTGVGGGGLMTLAQTIVSDVVTLRERLVSVPSTPKTSLLTRMRRKGKVSGHISMLHSFSHAGLAIC